MPIAWNQIKLHPQKDVIIEVADGAVQDYYLPDGLHIVIIDHDEEYEEAGQEKFYKRALRFMNKHNQLKCKQ
jgi:hypothetical protein